ncbi:hypothetical protein ACJX0J_031550, partial [Zea mays]
KQLNQYSTDNTGQTLIKSKFLKNKKKTMNIHIPQGPWKCDIFNHGTQSKYINKVIQVTFKVLFDVGLPFIGVLPFQIYLPIASWFLWDISLWKKFS